MDKRSLAVEQFELPSASQQAAAAAGMDLRAWKILALAAGWLVARNFGTADTKAAVYARYFVDCERVTFSCSAFCHTFEAWIDLNFDGGEGVTSASCSNFLNTSRR